MKNKDEKDVPVPDWRPVRPFTNFPPIEPQPFDTRDSTYIPDLSVGDAKVTKMSVRKIRGIGIRLYRSLSQTFNHATTDDIVYDQIAWQRGMDTHPQSSATIMIPHTGVYLIAVINGWAVHTGTARTLLSVNGVDLESVMSRSEGANALNSLTVVNSYDAGDQIAVNVYQSSDAAATRDTVAGEEFNSLTAVMLFSL